MSFQPRTDCWGCVGRAKPGTVALQAESLVRFPYAWSMGVYSCRKIAGSAKYSQHACGRAGDLGIPRYPSGAANTTLGFPVVRFLSAYSSEFGVVELIYNRVIYDRQSPGGRAYGGVHPHLDHVHYTITPYAASTLTRTRIQQIVSGTPTPIPTPDPGGDIEMTTSDFVKRLRKPDVQAICQAKGPGGLWVISPDSGDRDGITNYYVSILNQPANSDWIGFHREVEVAALINSTIKF